MSLTKNIVLTVTNEIEGITLTLKTVSTGDNGLVVSGDPGLYSLVEVKTALLEAEKFINEVKLIPPEETL